MPLHSEIVDDAVVNGTRTAVSRRLRVPACLVHCPRLSVNTARWPITASGRRPPANHGAPCRDVIDDEDAKWTRCTTHDVHSRLSCVCVCPAVYCNKLDSLIQRRAPVSDTIRYDTMRYAILTCAQKLTFSLPLGTKLRNGKEKK